MSVTETQADLPPVNVRRVINAPPAQVYAAWTDPNILAKWLGSPEVTVTEADVDARKGGGYRVVMRGTDTGRINTLFGTYRELSFAERLVFTWQSQRADGTISPESVVTVDLAPVEGARTEIRLTHARLSTEDARRSVRRGWGSSFDKLDSLLAQQQTTGG